MLEQLYTIVNTRYEDGRAVMLTTNLRDDELRDQIGDRTVSRLNEMCETYPLDGEDQRLDGHYELPEPAQAPVGRGPLAQRRRPGVGGRGPRRAARLRPPAGAPPRLRHGYGRHRDRGRPVGR